MNYSEITVRNNETKKVETTVTTTSKFNSKKSKKALAAKYPNYQYTTSERLL